MRAQDVIIVGGGIIGGAIALSLAQSKLRVAILERQLPGREASWAAAGMLSPAPDSPGAIPLVPFGRASLGLYPQFIAEVEELSGRRTGFRNHGAIELLFSADAERALSTLIALHHGLGLPTEPLPLDEARRLEPAIGREARAAALFAYESSVEPRALTAAVLAAAQAAGAELFPAAPATRLLTEGHRATGVATNAETFAAGNVVLAAGAFSAALEGVAPPAAVRPIRGQMVALSSTEARFAHVVRSERGYIVPRDDAMPQRAGRREHARGHRIREARDAGGTGTDSERGARTGAGPGRRGARRDVERLAAGHTGPPADLGARRDRGADLRDGPLP